MRQKGSLAPALRALQEAARGIGVRDEGVAQAAQGLLSQLLFVEGCLARGALSPAELGAQGIAARLAAALSPLAPPLPLSVLSDDELRRLRALLPPPEEDAPQALGTAHERALALVPPLRWDRASASLPEAPDPRRRAGSYYTPAEIVRYVIDNTLGALLPAPPAPQAPLTVLDPACGAGAFLLGAYRWLLAQAGPLDAAARLRLLATHLYGVDRDPAAVFAARLALVLCALGDDGRLLDLPLPDLSRTLRHGDALLDPETAPAAACDPAAPGLSFAAAFPEIFAPADPAAGFAVVVGNPPYLNGVEEDTRFAAPRRAHFARAYASARGAIDGSILFQELALRLLRPGGRCGLIVPNKFLAAPFGAAFRRLATSCAELRLLADLSAARAFPGLAVYPVVYVLCKTEAPRPHYPIRLQVFTPHPGPAREVVAAPAALPGWGQLFCDDPGLLHRLAALPRLGQVREVVAAATAGEAYQLRGGLCDAPPDAPHFLFLTSGSIDRYHHTHGRAKVRYLGKDYTAPCLLQGHPSLRPARRRLYAREKLVLASLTRRLEAIWDRGEIAAAVPAVLVLGEGADLRYELALLNSRLLSWCFRQSFAALSLRGGHLRVGPPQVRALPLHVIDESEPAERRRRDELCGLAEEMMTQHRHPQDAAAVQALDRRIDELVYSLYGLSDAEVARIESP